MVVAIQMPIDLQPHRGFAAALGAKDDGGRRFFGITIHLVPNRMVRAADAMLFEHLIRLSVFFGERIANDAVVFKKGLNVHLSRTRIIYCYSFPGSAWERTLLEAPPSLPSPPTLGRQNLQDIRLPRQSLGTSVERSTSRS